MKTAIEWLADQLKQQGFLYDLDIEAAKEIEKKQIIDAYNHNMTGFDKLEQEEIGLNWAEDYYNQTYNN